MKSLMYRVAWTLEIIRGRWSINLNFGTVDEIKKKQEYKEAPFLFMSSVYKFAH